MDLLDFFRNRHSWAKLERMIGQLSPRSRFKLAMIDDDEYADQIVSQIDELESTGPGLRDWSPEVGYLASVVDRLGDVIAAVYASRGVKPPKVKPLPRPKTAIDRARGRRSMSRHLSLVAEVEEARAKRQAQESSR